MNKMPPNFMDISVVIPVKNEQLYIEDCIKSVRNAVGNRFSYEIIVVDNGSEDDTAETARKNGAKVVVNEKAGPAATRNMGAEVSGGDIIAFIDADCLIDKKWFVYLTDTLRKPDVVAAGTKIAPDLDNCTWVERAQYLLRERRGREAESGFRSVPWIGTSNMMVKRQPFFDIGGFDETLMVAEDYDLCQKLRQYGHIFLTRKITTTHLRESKTLKEVFMREMQRGGNSLSHWLKNIRRIEESPSVILPFLFSLIIVFGIITVFNDFYIGLMCFFSASIIVHLKMYRALKNISDIPSFLQCFLISCVYLFARGTAIYKEMPSICIQLLR